MAIRRLTQYSLLKGIKCMSHYKQVSQGISEHKIFAIIRGVSPMDIVPTVEALLAGGIKLLEVTFNRAGPMSDTLHCLEVIRETFGDKVVCGVGTATDEQQIYAAARAGAQFVVSPDVNVEIIKLSRQLGMVSIPGAFTPTEVVKARGAGADYVKLFPGGLLGLPYFKAVSEVLKDVPIIVVGGINENNAHQFIDSGAVGVGVGGYLVNTKEVASGEFAAISQRAQQLVNSIHP